MFAYLVVLFFERRCPKQNTVAYKSQTICLLQTIWDGDVIAAQTCRIRRFYRIKLEVLADKDVVRNIFAS